MIVVKKCIIWIFWIFVVGCATTPYRVTTLIDDFDGYIIKRMQGNILGGGKPTISLYIQRHDRKDTIKYSLIAEYIGKNRLFVRSGESLIFIVNKDRIRLRGEGSSSRTNVIYDGSAEGGVMERAWYDITPEQLKKIAFAKKVRVKLEGRKHYVERHFTGRNLDNFRRFYNEYVKTVDGKTEDEQ